jgi:hypothetical protein
MAALVFDPENFELRFVAPWFKEQPQAVSKISWNVKRGSVVQAGDVLGTLTWSDGSEEDLIAPQGCSGTVEAANTCIPYANLDKRPAEVAVRFEVANAP